MRKRNRMLFEDGKSEVSYALIKIIASIQGGNKTVVAKILYRSCTV